MKENKLLGGFLILLFWLGVWWLIAAIVNQFTVPSPIETYRVLIELLRDPNTYAIIAGSLFRVLAALFIGIGLGLVLGILAGMNSYLEALFKPLMNVIKATPVVSFIIILFMYVKGNSIAIICGVLLCFPIIYNNILQGYKMVNTELISMSNVFKVPLRRKISKLYVPSTLPYLFAGILTSIGICWKATIAAELIGYVNNSIGIQIHNGRIVLEFDFVFAWTAIIIVCSVLIEYVTKKIIQSINVYERHKVI